MIYARRQRIFVLSRSLSTRSSPSLAYLNSEDHGETVSTTPSGLTNAQRASLDRALRVDQAGEVAANWIYQGQMAVLGLDREVGPVIQVRYSHSQLVFIN